MYGAKSAGTCILLACSLPRTGSEQGKASHCLYPTLRHTKTVSLPACIVAGRPTDFSLKLRHDLSTYYQRIYLRLCIFESAFLANLICRLEIVELSNGDNLPQYSVSVFRLVLFVFNEQIPPLVASLSHFKLKMVHGKSLLLSQPALPFICV